MKQAASMLLLSQHVPASNQLFSSAAGPGGSYADEDSAQVLYMLLILSRTLHGSLRNGAAVIVFCRNRVCHARHRVVDRSGRLVLPFSTLGEAKETENRAETVQM